MGNRSTAPAAPLLDDRTNRPLNGVQDVELVPTGASLPPAAVDHQPTNDNFIHLFERLARDPNTSVDKIERLMALWERGEARKSEAAFNRAMSAAQQEMKPVVADADNPQTHSQYASYEALDYALRPIYTKHGFALSFNTGLTEKPDTVPVLCDVVHQAGHSKAYRIDMPADGKGAKGGDVMTRTHATGSAVSYGMRYLLKMIFNVAVKDRADDDGNRASGRQVPDTPAGYDAWFATLEGVAEGGMKAFSEAWNHSKPEFRTYLAQTAPKLLASIKTKAGKKP